MAHIISNRSAGGCRTLRVHGEERGHTMKINHFAVKGRFALHVCQYSGEIGGSIKQEKGEGGNIEVAKASRDILSFSEESQVQQNLQTSGRPRTCSKSSTD
jgi:hypothetical protein